MSELMALRALRVGYGRRPLLPAIDLAIRAGQVWAVMGPNGAGKSTLLRTVLRALRPVGGAIQAAPDLAMSYLPQRNTLDLSVPGRVRDVVRGGADRGWSFLVPGTWRPTREAVARALADTETTALARERFARLGEGEKQRVLIARALVAEPSLLVLDEPTSAMDAAHERSTFALVRGMAARRGMAVLVVSHAMLALVESATHGLLIDKDEALVLAGPIREVAVSHAFTARYGHLLHAERAHG